MADPEVYWLDAVQSRKNKLNSLCEGPKVEGGSQETHGREDEIVGVRVRERERKGGREKRTMANSSLPAAEDVSHEISHRDSRASL